MERCPLCRALLHGGDVCRRCRADLALVWRAEQQSAALLGTAMLRLAQGDDAAAARLLRRALVLHATPMVQRLLGLAMVAQRRGDCPQSER